jgi:hypothetical protein
MNTLLSINNAADRAAVAEQNFQTLDALLVPIGAMLPWAKSLPGVPALSSRFVECNGQVLNDPESPLDGQTIYNLNGAGGGTKRFLRGSSTSGTTGGAETHAHAVSFSNSNTAQAGTDFTAAENGAGGITDAQSHLPPYCEVVWVMRVK